MNDVSKTITYNGRTYRIVFNLNVMEAIQEEYKTIQNWGNLTDGGENGEPDAKAVIFGVAAMINEGIDIDNEENGTDIKPLTLKQVGRLITAVGIDVAAKQMKDTVIESTESTEKNA